MNVCAPLAVGPCVWDVQTMVVSDRGEGYRVDVELQERASQTWREFWLYCPRPDGESGQAVDYVRVALAARRWLWAYLRGESRTNDEAVFLAHSGPNTDQPLTRSGLWQLLSEMGKRAGIRGRCSPHTLRHTFAVEFLRNGGNTFALQQLLGHTDLKMTQRYVALAQADLENQHRMASPMDRLKRRRPE